MECLNNEGELPQEETRNGEGKTSAPQVAASSDANASKEKASKPECSSCDADHASSERESGKCVLITGKFVVHFVGIGGDLVVESRKFPFCRCFCNVPGVAG